MAGGLGRRMIAQCLNFAFNKSPTAPGTTYYISLHTAAPGVDGQAGNEATGTGYARASIAAGSLTAANVVTPVLPGVVENTGSLAFAVSGGAWSSSAPLTHFGIWDHLTNTAEANFIGWASLGASQTVTAAGVTLTFAAGALDMTGNSTP